ncbi:centrosomal protein of 68 kDa isoform X2 [Antennarius striatus]|uniref:centrosomal protein of 68 kDa isoform X2 n=1 Tax=Antennarius striatus TaxID=241820 RepID=UPI0035B336ED
MEATGHERRWTTRLLNRRFPDETERAADSRQPHKSVAMAPKSRYLTDRRYSARKPLFATEQHASILKKTDPPEHTQRDKQLDPTRRDEHQLHPAFSVLTRAREALPPETFDLSHSDISSSSGWRDDLGSPLAVSELRVGPFSEGSPFPVRRPSQRSPSSSILEVQRFSPPMRPRLTSTVLHPTYTPRLGGSRMGRTRLGQGGRAEQSGEGDKERSQSKVSPMSPHQANYWACAIPKAPPPSPDRSSSRWDPNREYQALLDYTYPLRPGQVVTEWNPSKLRGDSLLLTDPNFQDSGIEPDQLCSSRSLSGLGFSLSVGHRSPDLQAFTQSDPDSSISQSDPVDFSRDSPDGKSRRGTSRQRHHHRPPSSSSSSSLSPAFIRSTSLLPRSRCFGGEVDEEFRPLPEQLEELQLLSRQVREATAQLSRPLGASWESLDPDATSILSSTPLLLEKQEEDGDQGEELGAKYPGGSRHSRDEMIRQEMSAAHTADWGSKAWGRSSEAWVEPVRGVSQSGLGEAERLRGVGLRRNQESQEQNESLMQHIQVEMMSNNI